MSALMSRRELLAAGVGLAALRSREVRAAEPDAQLNLPNRRAAYEPWYSWRADVPQSALAIVHSAVLAANAHDTQPWKFRIDADRIDVYADTDRHLGAMDPFRREMHLSLGCALENAALMARAIGYAANIEFAGGSLREEGSARALRRVASIGLGTLAGFCGDSQWQPTFAFRAGWPTRTAAASPRRTLQSVVMPPRRADS
jgi:hypothetical protein